MTRILPGNLGVLFMAWLITVGRPAAAAPVTEIHYVMGTYFSITTDDVAEPEARTLMRRCFNEARRLEAVFSRYDATSELSRLNARGDGGAVEVSSDFADLLARSLQLQAATGGRFDVTIGALTPVRGADLHGSPFPQESVDKWEHTLRQAQGERKKSFEISPRTAQAEPVEACPELLSRNFCAERADSPSLRRRGLGGGLPPRSPSFERGDENLSADVLGLRAYACAMQTRRASPRLESTGSRGQKRILLADRRLVLAPGVQLDFDGIAKGYTVDRCVTLLREAGVRRALLSLGESSQYAIGAPLGAAAWPVTVRGLSGDRAVGTLALRDQALSVSSALTPQGHVAHVIDPRSGQPVREPSVVVVVMDSATDAEAWSKALLIEAMPVQPNEPPAALRITRHGIERWGGIAFVAYASPRPIGPDAEPLL